MKKHLSFSFFLLSKQEMQALQDCSFGDIFSLFNFFITTGEAELLIVLLQSLFSRLADMIFTVLSTRGEKR